MNNLSISLPKFILIASAWFLISPCQAQPSKDSTQTSDPVMVNPNGQRDLQVQNQPLILRAEAYAGRPYGIGKIKFRLRVGDELVTRTNATLLSDAENRVLYPVISKSPAKTFFQSLFGKQPDNPDDAHTMWFLFQGDQPLRLRLDGSGGTAFEVPVEFARDRQFRRTVDQWWQGFNRSIKEQIEKSDYPPMAEVYLMSMLGKRFGLQVDDPFNRKKDPLMQTFELMFDVESLRSDTIRNAMLKGNNEGVANQPLPQPIRWSPVVVSQLPEGIEVEPIAKCIPKECFYLRFGTWNNQIWLQQLMEEFGGDLSRMVQVRGFKQKIQSKFLDQLAIQSSEWDRLFGGNLIDDVAVIGTDTYFDNGAAVGVVLHARASETLKNNLLAKRKKFARDKKSLGVTLQTIDFEGTEISLLSTPDNRYRSFYVVSGNCHLMSTSLALAQRFVEAGQGKDSLGDLPEYQFARYRMPCDREDTVFIYLSTDFFKQLLTPQNQIELRRRNRIVTDIMIFELAHLAAANENYADRSIEGLIRGGYLPQGFRSRNDNGTFELIENRWQDSIRGQRGFFAPIPDLPLKQVTLEEVNWFNERADFFTKSIRSLDPMFVAIKRYELGEKVERVVFDSRIAPFGEDKYGWLMSMLGPPLQQEVPSTPEDIVRIQASIRSGRAGKLSHHQIFAAVQDYVDPNVDLRPTSVLKSFQALKEAPGYLGAWPTPGFLDWLPSLGGAPDPYGYTYSRLLNLWRLQWDGFSVISFDQQRLESLKPHLQVVPTERPAHVRLNVGDLANSKIRDWANTVNYRRSWQTSIANVKLLNMLTQQFRVPPDEANEIVERMLNVELVCSLGGQYALANLASGRPIWHSTAWPSFSNPTIPDGHTAPVLTWFRGLEVEVSKTPNQFVMHGFLDIQRTESAGGLPSFDLFKGFGSFFGSDSDKETDKEGNKNND
ncbi:MAG: hypothetical protein AAF939_16590 [Planctomycetota bacterium]